MPIKKAPKSANKATRRKIASAGIREFNKGKTYAKTRKKFGKARADAQAVAAGLNAAGLRKKRKKG